MPTRRQIRESEGPWAGSVPTWRTAFVVALLALAVGAFPADKQPPTEYQVKAAFLLNFTKFIEWPPSESAAATPFSLCILGDDPFGGSLDRIVEGETVEGRRLAVRRIRRQQSPSCQVVFASRAEKDLPQILPGLGSGVLTVCEGENALRDGCMIAFVVENRRVRFDINQPAAAKAALKISSKLLSVARSVAK